MKKLLFTAISVAIVLCGCTSKKDSLSPDVYKESDVNKRQEIKSIDIVSLEPAKIAINNNKSKNTARVIGGALGAIGGAVVGYNFGSGKSGATVVGGAVGGTLGGLGGEAMGDEKVVDGITILYEQNGKTYSSTQVGKPCEFKIGVARMVIMDGSVTKIQPNSVCN